MKARALTSALLVALLLTTTACLGPKPVVEKFDSHSPTGPDQPFKVEATVSNSGPGSGQVEVEVTLSNKQDGTIIIRDQKDVDLQKGDTENVLFNLDLPPSAENLDPASIDVKVDAHYPIE